MRSATEAPAANGGASRRKGREPRIVIDGARTWSWQRLGELWHARDVLYLLVWRDVKVRYKQTALGILWALVQPLAFMLVFALFFRRLGTRGAGDLPYPLFVLAGLLPWLFFSSTVTSASQSIVNSRNLVTKVYFPRLLIPLSTVGTPLLDFAIGLGLLLAANVVCTAGPGSGLVLLPMLIVLLIVTALGVGTLFAALAVTFRDVRFLLPFVMQVWMFVTPGIYLQADDRWVERFRLALALNPLQGLIAGFRNALTGAPLLVDELLVSATVGVILMGLGVVVFQRMERSFADVI